MTKLQDALNNYTLKGFILKQISEALTEHVDGVLEGLAAEVLEDDSAIIYKLVREDLLVRAKPYLNWSNGELNDKVRHRAIQVTYRVPEGRSVGLFVSKSLKILVPLRA